jgi:hypothetical protein
MNRFQTLCVVALMLIAGCASPVQETERATLESESSPGTAAGVDTATTQEAETATTQEAETATTQEVPGDDVPLDIDEAEVFSNVEALLSVEATSPYLSVSREDSRGPVVSTPGRFARVLGVSNATRDEIPPVSGRASRDGVVELTLFEAAGRRDVGTFLVHEYAHSIQFQLDSYRTVRGVTSASSAHAAQAVTEGAAVYVTQEYAKRYEGVRNQQTSVCTAYDEGAPATKLALDQYCVGARYIEDRIDSPDELTAIYENPPMTTEQIRHGLDPGTEPARPLAVSPTGTEEWTVTTAGLPTGYTRQGELWTYAVLTTYLSDERADRAATGWGNDRLVRYGNGSETNRVWVTRWDDPGEANEFASAMDAHVGAAAANGTTDAAFELVRVNETVVALVAGADAFVAEASVEMDDGTVVVRPPQARTNATDSIVKPVEPRAPRTPSSVGLREAVDANPGAVERIE